MGSDPGPVFGQGETSLGVQGFEGESLEGDLGCLGVQTGWFAALGIWPGELIDRLRGFLIEHLGEPS